MKAIVEVAHCDKNLEQRQNMLEGKTEYLATEPSLSCAPHTDSHQLDSQLRHLTNNECILLLVYFDILIE